MAKVDLYPAFTASGVKVTSAVGDGPRGVRFEWPDGHALFTDLPEQGMYLDACDGAGGPVAIVTGHDTDTAYLVTPTGVETLAKTHGIRACAVNIVNGSLRWVFVHNTTHYIDTGEVKPLPADQIQTSQGILALEPSGRINWAAPPDRVEDGLYHKVNAGSVSAGLYAQGDQLTVLDAGAHTVFNGLCHNIRIVARTDVRYGVCARNEGNPIFAVGPPWPDFIEPTEPLPPLESVPLLNRPFGLACYCFNNANTVGNLELPIRPWAGHIFQSPVIATTDDESFVHDDVLWAIYSGESQDVPAEQAIQAARIIGSKRKRGLTVYQDSYPMRDSLMALSEDGDILTPQVFRNAGEDIGHYRTRLRSAFMDGSIFRETWPTINIHQRYSGDQPTLSVRDVVEGFVTATQIAHEMGWPGMVLFRVGTTDVPEDIWPYVDRFMSGITGTPDPRVLEDNEPEEPEEPDGMNVYLLVTPAAAPAANKVPPPGTTKLLGSRENQSDGSFAIKKPNGKYATLNPQAQWEERDAVLGNWEKFYDGKPGFILAPNRDNQCFTLQAVQGP
jgi:hypothetical protein